MESSNDDHNQNQTKNLKRTFDKLYVKPHVEVFPSQESLITNLVPRRFGSVFSPFFFNYAIHHFFMYFFCNSCFFCKNDHKDCILGFMHFWVSCVLCYNFYRDQLEAFEIAKRRNTIAIMDTGSGKTLIAIMLIKEIGQAVRSSGDKKIIVFLAPTVVLVNQACSFLNSFIS